MGKASSLEINDIDDFDALKDNDEDDKIKIINNNSKNKKVQPLLDGNVGNNSNHILKKLDIIHINNGWNDHNERIIISIGENCASYKWMHDKCSVYYKIINDIINIISILFTSFLTAETFVKDDASSETIIILRKVITYSLSVISLLQNFLKVDTLQITHANASNEFSKLYHDIQQQMCRFRRERKNATRYVSECLKKYDSLVINNPNINNFILYRFRITFKNTDIPNIEDRFNRIEIITENDQNNMLNKNVNLNTPNEDTEVVNIFTDDVDKRQDINMEELNKINVINVTNNLSNIHKMCKISGDISDSDLKNIDHIELKRLNEHKMMYEYNRFKQHSHEDD